MVGPDQKLLPAITISILSVLACPGCGQPSGEAVEATVLGSPPQAAVQTVAVRAFSDELLGQQIVVEGTVVQQCPSVGCWFQVDDGSGKVLVDLNPAGWHVRQKRVGSRVRVAGKLVRAGAEYRIEASYVEFRVGNTQSDGQQAE